MNLMAAGTVTFREEKPSTFISDAHFKVADDFLTLVNCPRSENDVYSFAIKLEYYIGSLFMALAEIKEGNAKADCTNLAFKQLDRKEKIAKINNDKLNELLQFFYDNDGPIIEPLVDEKRSREITPLFRSILDKFLNQMDIIVKMISTGNIAANQMELKINSYLIEMYTAMIALYQEEEMRRAFGEMIQVRND